MEDSFEWGKYIGIGNWNRNVPPEVRKNDPSLHSFPLYYTENPPEMTYGDLKDIISTVKRVGKEITGFDIEAGKTFDPGPEFSYSEFKYERHPEIAMGNTMGSKKWLHCAARLHADTRKYAAYPSGIPEGTHIGEFLGRQFMAVKRDIGFDYIWLSNGFGFSLASWDWLGETFNGKEFNSGRAAEVRKSIMEFWKYFSAEIGDTRVETRGSNLSSGMDISAHGCPIDEVYNQKNLVCPCNSPWAPLDQRFGLELAGYMSHIANLTDKGYPFRYYVHDPWWLNSPWFDRYDRSPHDIYLPLAITRLDAECNVTKPLGISILTADDSLGRMPERCPNEVIPHILSAYNDFADQAGLMTWVYPIDTYTGAEYKNNRLPSVFMGDWFIESVIDQGCPVNTVISDGNFIKADKKKLIDTILISIVPEAGSELESALFDAIEAGGKVILYGSLRYASERLLRAVGVKYEDEIFGDLNISTSLKLDNSETDRYSDILQHNPLVSDGGVGEVSYGTTEVTAIVENDGNRRTYATYNSELNLVWVRGSFPHENGRAGQLPPLRLPSKNFVPSILVRASMQCFGYPMRYDLYSVDDKLPISMFSRQRNAIYFTLFAKDASVKLHFSTPMGVPAFDNSEFIIENNEGTYPLSRWIHTDCRIFIRQKNRSKITIKKEHVISFVDADERYQIEGLDDADIIVYHRGGKVWLEINMQIFGRKSLISSAYDEKNGCYRQTSSGLISVLWQTKKTSGIIKRFLRKD